MCRNCVRNSRLTACSWRRAAAAGAVLGLAYLTDTANLALVIPFVLLAFFARTERRWAAAALSCFEDLMSPYYKRS